MVKEERREDDVHDPVAEGKAERVGDDGGSARGEPRMRRLPVEAEDADARSRFGGRRQEVAAHVPRAAAEVEDLERVLPPGQRREKRLEAPPDEGPAAEPVVHPLDVGEARLGLARRDAGAVEELEFGTSMGNPE